VGAASAWLILNIGYVFFEIPVMHKKILRDEMWRWYWNDISVPILTALSFAGVGRLLLNDSVSQPMMVLQIISISVITVAITVVSVPTIRSILIDRFLRIKLHFN
ncbi:MAG: hypothetical protein PHP42_08615, partial [Bacteroidota bacterium]|nr:hypothetical protein [Bacteroidota bacterium]